MWYFVPGKPNFIKEGSIYIMKALLNYFSSCYKIVYGRKANRRQRIIASSVLAITSLLILTISFMFGGFISTTFLYFMYSALKHVTELWANWSEWGLLSTVFYEIGRVGKEWLIEENKIASFLNACNASSFGKTVQIIFLLVGTALFVKLFVIFCRSINVMYNTCIEGFLINHKGGWFYHRKLREFVETYSLREYSSKEMMENRLYKVFASEPRVKHLLEFKKAREEENNSKVKKFESKSKSRRRHG